MKLYSMVIVDDEPIILKGLVETFDWLSMGFCVAGSAKNGIDALELIDKLKPDVLITDIMMKKMDGLELICRCQEKHPHMRFVVVSAYREFDFAQRACSLGVFSYLLKPLDESQISMVMRDLRGTIEMEYAGREQLHSYKKVFLQQKHAIETRDLKQFLMYNEDACSLNDRLRMVESDAGGDDWYMAACMDISASDRILEQIDIGTQRFALADVLREKVGERFPCWCFELPDGRLVLIVKPDSGEGDISFLRSSLAYAESILKLHITAALSRAGRGYDGLRQTYRQALRTFELGSESGANVIPAGPEPGDKPPPAWYPANHENEVIHAIRLNDADRAVQSFGAFAGAATGDGGLELLCCHRLALSILFFLKETYGLTAPVEQILYRYLDDVQRLKAGEAREVLAQTILRVIAARCELSGNVADTHADRYIAESQNYIERNLGVETLSVCDVSGHLHLNAAYFGRLFKNKTGKSFKEFLQQKRIEKAMRLLEATDRSVIEVAQEVGIQNPSYFSALFKHHTGILPSNYKRTINQ